MTRPLTAFLIGLVVMAGSFLGANALAQDEEPRAGHPLVGSWLVSFPDNPGTPPSLYTFGADGTVVGTSSDGARHGSWAATGPRTADLTVVGLSGPGPTVAALIRFRGSAEVGETDDTVRLEYDAELFAPDGTVLSGDATATAEGNRITAERREATGTPTGDGASPVPGTPAVGTPMVDEAIATALATAMP